MRLACCQLNVVFNDPSANAQKLVNTLNDLKSKQVEFAVFPEAFLTGYCVTSPNEANQIAIQQNHPSIQTIKQAVEQTGITTVVGFAENRNGTLLNTAALIEKGEPNRFYSKTHLPELGYDKFVKGGEDLPVFETKHGRVGIIICFDLRPPEAARVLALKGADLVVLPTNWPEGAQVSAEHVSIARASENRVFLATCDRVGTENGFSFIGLSKIISPTGKVLASAGNTEEIITAEVDLKEARNKRNVVIPGKYEMTVFESRRPELYDAIVDEEPAKDWPETVEAAV